MNVFTIIHEIENAGGTCYFVGGYVRDKILGINSNDIDVEVFGLMPEQLKSILLRFDDRVDLVGAEFGVFKLGGFDFTIARTERLTGVSHRDFEVTLIPNGDIKTAAMRRDFTINAIYMTPDGKYIDPFGGIQDIENGVLRVISKQSFSDDPLRVLRGFQFAGRFDMVAAPETIMMAENVVDRYDTISPERIWIEWEKWAEKSIKPSAGLWFLADVGWLKVYPELEVLADIPQNPTYHPEGSVWEHTLQAVDIADTAVLRFAALTHDLGKASTTLLKDGRIVSPGHAESHEPVNFLESIRMPHKIKVRVIEMVRFHMWHYNDVSAKRVRRLLVNLKHATVQDIYDLIVVDYAARWPLLPVVPKNAKLMLELAEIEADKIEPILKGRHLIEMGFTPGKNFGVVLKAIYQQQIEGIITDIEAAKRRARQYLSTMV